MIRALPSALLACGSVLGCAPVDTPLQSSLSVVVCPRSTLEGIDVSVYQGTIDWAMVRAAGKSFAFARAAHGTAEDTMFARNWPAIRANGMVRGAYLYWVPSQDALTQANILVRRVGRLSPGDLPAVIDVEETGGLSPTAMTAQLRTIVARVTEGTGRSPILYSGLYFWNTSVRSTMFVSHPLWVPQYNRTCPDIPNPWTQWAFWQHSNTGRVPGIRGNVDLDHFEGSMSDLRALAGYPVLDAGADAGRDATTDTLRDIESPRDVPADAPGDASTDIPGDARPDATAQDVPADVTADVTATDAAPDARATDGPATDGTATDGTATDGTDAQAGDEAPTLPPAGCGCVAGTPSTHGLWLLLALAALRRRRSGEPRLAPAATPSAP